MFVEQQYVLARAKLHFTPVVLTPRAHLQRVEESKTLSPIPPLGRESNSLAESGVLLEDTKWDHISVFGWRKEAAFALLTVYSVQSCHWKDISVLTVSPGQAEAGRIRREAEQHLQRFIDVDQAWKILSNEESRKEYNLQLRGTFLRLSSYTLSV
ncbi:dnaJ subfamily C [Pimephales promelas]|nr:dnaJ subfamily C [Pimephales promelas]